MNIPCSSCGSEECWCNHEGPYVCPGCHAVGAEPCAPGCIDAEMAQEREDDLTYGRDSQIGTEPDDNDEDDYCFADD